MVRSISASFAPEKPLVVLTDRFDRSAAGRCAMALVHWASAFGRDAGRHPIRAIVWTKGPDGWALTDGFPVHEIEDVNSWALPRELARAGPTLPLARALRSARVRPWRAGLGAEPAVVVLDEAREELRHYRPPSTRPSVGADVVSEVLTADLWGRAIRRRFGIPADARVIGSWGPPTWRSGIDQFVAAAAAPGVERDHFVWFLPRSTPMAPAPIHDAGALGVDDRFHWHEAPGDPADPLVGCDAVLDAGRTPVPDLAGGEPLPVVRYGSGSVTALAARPEQLAEALARSDHRRGSTDDELAERLGWTAES